MSRTTNVRYTIMVVDVGYDGAGTYLYGVFTELDAAHKEAARWTRALIKHRGTGAYATPIKINPATAATRDNHWPAR